MVHDAFALLLRLTALVVALLAAAGCSNGSSSPTTTVSTAPSTTAALPSTVTTTTAPPTSPPTTAAPTTAAPTTVPAIDPNAAVLTLADLPPGFVAETPAPSPPGATLLCGTPPVEQVVPSQASVEVTFRNDESGVLLQQTVSVYPDVATAQAALAAGRAGVACGTGSSTASDGSVTTFQLAPQVLPAPLGDEVMAYAGSLTQGGVPFGALLAAVRDGRAVSALQLVVVEGGQAPDGFQLLSLAADRLRPA